MVMRLHTGHNRLNAHMFRKMKLAPSPTCNCGLKDQTAEKILQRCPLLQTARTSVWPTAVQLHTKLYGIREELEKTLSYIHLPDWTLSVAAIEKRNKQLARPNTQLAELRPRPFRPWILFLVSSELKINHCSVTVPFPQV